MFSDPSLGSFILSLSDRSQRTQDQLQLLSLRTTSKSYVRAYFFLACISFSHRFSYHVHSNDPKFAPYLVISLDHVYTNVMYSINNVCYVRTHEHSQFHDF
jgi:hypothetical protein